MLGRTEEELNRLEQRDAITLRMIVPPAQQGMRNSVQGKRERDEWEQRLIFCFASDSPVSVVMLA